MAASIKLHLDTLSHFTFIWVVLLLSSLAVMAKTYHRPNIVLILTDDLDISNGGMVIFWRLSFSNSHVNRVNEDFILHALS